MHKGIAHLGYQDKYLHPSFKQPGEINPTLSDHHTHF